MGYNKNKEEHTDERLLPDCLKDKYNRQTSGKSWAAIAFTYFFLCETEYVRETTLTIRSSSKSTSVSVISYHPPFLMLLRKGSSRPPQLVCSDNIITYLSENVNIIRNS